MRTPVPVVTNVMKMETVPMVLMDTQLLVLLVGLTAPSGKEIQNAFIH